MGKRRLFTVLLLSSLLVAVSTPPVAGVNGTDNPGLEMPTPDTANPFLGLLPAGARPDYQRWQAYIDSNLRTRSSGLAPGARPLGLRLTEQEPSEQTGVNDTLATAEPVGRFGTGRGDIPVADILGTAPLTPVGDVLTVAPVESDDAISQSTDTQVFDSGDLANGSAVVGDGNGGSAGSGTGDFDFYKIPAVSVGEVLQIEVNTAIPLGDADLDPSLALWDSAGNLVAFNEDISAVTDWDARIVFRASVAGDYYASVGGYGSFYPLDPTDPDSPSFTGTFGSEGEYDISVQLLNGDVDVYQVSLEAGDVMAASVAGLPFRLSLIGPDGIERIGSAENSTFVHPRSSPLFANLDAIALSYMIDETGTYYVAVHSVGGYQANLQVFRPAKELSARGTQVLFIDFDGITLDLGELAFGFPPGTRTTLSPLSAFLGRWGLSPTDEDAVIDAILAVVEENLSEDIRAMGSNGNFDATGLPGDFDIEIRNSRDHVDPWGSPYVSRVIVGGTIAQLGIPVLGIADSIDVGDFDSEETAFTLLDAMSSSPDEPFYTSSLNAIPRDPSADIIELIGVAVGNIVSHEAGHIMGNWHTDQFDLLSNIQDQGGNLPGKIGLGPDGIFGTVDDIDVDFGPDFYVPNEGFTGIEDTLESIAFGLSTGTGLRNR